MDYDAKKNKMLELISRLNAASAAYYNGEEIMSNFEYDKLYDELTALETETGEILPDSPTQRAGAEAVDELPKFRHEFVALSLAKTKDVDEYIARFREHVYSTRHEEIHNRKHNNHVTVMWKCDGSTVQLYYNGGRLEHAVTRGNGEVGSVIDHNAPYIKGIPMTIAFSGKLVVRGEALMTYTEFERINSELPVEEQYKNPRNLANATISLLDSREMRRREIEFHAFDLVAKEDSPADREKHAQVTECKDADVRGAEPVESIWFNDLGDDFMERLNWLADMGFNVVERTEVSVDELKDTLAQWEKRVPEIDFPVDGLVCTMSDCAYSRDLPGTGHNPHIMKGMALKWQDETAETTLRDIKWQATRTGLLAPVAEFDPVELEGTTVVRATLHNLSYILSMDLKLGDTVQIAKMNKIIPAVVQNDSKEREWEGEELPEDLKERYAVPAVCPVCGAETEIEFTGGNTRSFVVKCPNPECAAKKIRSLAHFCERDCMNIIGMSEATVEKFVDEGIIHDYTDFFKLDEHPEIAEMEGFGEKSWQKFVNAAENAKKCTFSGLFNALGIANLGKGQAKLLYNYYAQNGTPGERVSENFLADVKAGRDLSEIEGIGPVMNQAIHAWAEENLSTGETALCTVFEKLYAMVDITDDVIPEKTSDGGENTASAAVSGKTFVITGAVNHFKNRDELKEKIESLGGKAAGSVSSKTDFLINNDVTSTSGKNKKAKELNIPIISEEDFLKMIGEM